jgi:hypothetical protein
MKERAWSSTVPSMLVYLGIATMGQGHERLWRKSVLMVGVPIERINVLHGVPDLMPCCPLAPWYGYGRECGAPCLPEVTRENAGAGRALSAA